MTKNFEVIAQQKKQTETLLDDFLNKYELLFKNKFFSSDYTTEDLNTLIALIAKFEKLHKSDDNFDFSGMNLIIKNLEQQFSENTLIQAYLAFYKNYDCFLHSPVGNYSSIDEFSVHLSEIPASYEGVSEFLENLQKLKDLDYEIKRIHYVESAHGDENTFSIELKLLEYKFESLKNRHKDLLIKLNLALGRLNDCYKNFTDTQIRATQSLSELRHILLRINTLPASLVNIKSDYPDLYITYMSDLEAKVNSLTLAYPDNMLSLTLDRYLQQECTDIPENFDIGDFRTLKDFQCFVEHIDQIISRFQVVSNHTSELIKKYTDLKFRYQQLKSDIDEVIRLLELGGLDIEPALDIFRKYEPILRENGTVDRNKFKAMQLAWSDFKNQMPVLTHIEDIVELTYKNNLWLNSLDVAHKLVLNSKQLLPLDIYQKIIKLFESTKKNAFDYPRMTWVRLSPETYKNLVNVVRANITWDLELFKQNLLFYKDNVRKINDLLASMGPYRYLDTVNALCNELDNAKSEFLHSLYSKNIPENTRSKLSLTLRRVEGTFMRKQQQVDSFHNYFSTLVEKYKVLKIELQKHSNPGPKTWNNRFFEHVTQYLEDMQREPVNNLINCFIENKLNFSKDLVDECFDLAHHSRNLIKVIDEKIHQSLLGLEYTNEQKFSLELLKSEMSIALDTLSVSLRDYSKRPTDINTNIETLFKLLDATTNCLIVYYRVRTQYKQYRPSKIQSMIDPTSKYIELTCKPLIESLQHILPLLDNNDNDKEHLQNLHNALLNMIENHKQNHKQNISVTVKQVNKELTQIVNYHLNKISHFPKIYHFFVILVNRVKTMYLTRFKKIDHASLKLFNSHDANKVMNNPAVKILKDILENKHIMQQDFVSNNIGRNNTRG